MVASEETVLGNGGVSPCHLKIETGSETLASAVDSPRLMNKSVRRDQTRDEAKGGDEDEPDE